MEALADLQADLCADRSRRDRRPWRRGTRMLARRRSDRGAALPPRARDLGGRRRLAPRSRPRRALTPGRLLDGRAASSSCATARHVLLADHCARAHCRARVLRPQVGCIALDGQPRGSAEPTVVWQADGGTSARSMAMARRRRRMVGANDACGRLGRRLGADLQAQARAQLEPRRPLTFEDGSMPRSRKGRPRPIGVGRSPPRRARSHRPATREELAARRVAERALLHGRFRPWARAGARPSTSTSTASRPDPELLGPIGAALCRERRAHRKPPDRLAAA